MEFCSWDRGQRTNKGTYALVPPALDTLSQLYKHVVKFVDHFPFKKRLVLYFVFRGTSVKIDLGDAKAAGVVCVLGIGVGLGSLLFYRFYYNYIRPIISRQNSETDTDSDIYQDDDCCYYSGSSDTVTNTDMGSVKAKESPPHYESQYGFGYEPKQTRSKTRDESVRLRKKGRQSSMNSDKDSAIGGASELGQSFYSDGGINRDSFYSTCTAESGFENMPDNFDDSSSVEGYTLKRYPSLSQSLQVNFSPKSLNNKLHSYRNSSEEKSGQTLLAGETDDLGTVLLTPPSDDDASASHKRDPSHLQVDKSEKSLSYSAEYDASLEISDSLQSYSADTGSLGDWSCEEEDRDLMSPLPNVREPMSDYQFKQTVMQRLREWSSLSVDNKSRSPTPERFSMSRSVRRSRSLDRHMSGMCTPDSEIFENETIDFSANTTKNLEHIEGELQDIQEEFCMITSQLSDLIHRGDEEKTQKAPPPSPVAKRACDLVLRTRTRWERSPSLTYSDSERSSRDGSVELAWDLGDIGDDELPRTIRNRRKLFSRRQNTVIPEEQKNGTTDRNTSVSSSEDSPLKHNVQMKSTPTADSTGEDLEEDSVPPDEVSHSQTQKKKPRGRLKNIGDCVNIREYAEREWQGQTPRANTIKTAYGAIPSQMNCHHLKQIRGDNYCAIRGCLYQVLCSGHPVTKGWPGIVETVNTLHKLYQDDESGLNQWSFANRIASKDENRLTRMCECVFTLYSTIEDICKLPTYEEREQYTSDLLNSESTVDLELMEGVKLLMALTSVDLHHASEKGEDVPLFVWLMFARDSCQNVTDFVKNHLNCVGNTGGLEQVEMCLLGHTLGVRIQVARLQDYPKEEFLCQFPDDSPVDWPLINLLAEDDRHYNVPIP